MILCLTTFSPDKLIILLERTLEMLLFVILIDQKTIFMY